MYRMLHCHSDDITTWTKQNVLEGTAFRERGSQLAAT